MEEFKITEEMLLDLLDKMEHGKEKREHEKHIHEYEIKKRQEYISKLDKEIEDIEQTKKELISNINIIRERNKNND